MRYLLLIICSLALMTSCSPEGVTRLDRQKHYVAISPQKVKVFVDEQDVPKRHEKVALIAGSTSEDWSVIRRRCAKLGANGVYRKFYLTNSRQANGYQSAERIEYIAIRY